MIATPSSSSCFTASFSMSKYGMSGPRGFVVCIVSKVRTVRLARLGGRFTAMPSDAADVPVASRSLCQGHMRSVSKTARFVP